MIRSSPDPQPPPTHVPRWGALVGVVGSLAIAVQNAGFATGMGWAVMHGAGLVAVVALLPLALGLGLLWAGFVLLCRTRMRRGLTVFVGYTLVLLALNEWLLPGTPLKAWASERALRSAEVLSIRDEVVTTATGDPTGVRLVFEVRFPRRVVASVSSSAFVRPETEPPWLPDGLDFRGYEQTIEPVPDADDIYHVFETDVIYRVEVITRPGFRPVDYRTGRPCRETPPGMSDDEILTALRRRGNHHYRGEIHVNGPDVPVNIVVTEYQTSRPYDLEAMYQAALREELEPCRR